MFVAVDTLVEHTKPIGEHSEEFRNNKRTSHPISVAIGKTVVKVALDTKCDKGDNIDRIYVTLGGVKSKVATASVPCKVREVIVIRVVAKTGPFSRNRVIKETLATRANNREIVSITFRLGGLCGVSAAMFRLVRTCQLSVRPEISSRMEKGMTNPEITGRMR